MSCSTRARRLRQTWSRQPTAGPTSAIVPGEARRARRCNGRGGAGVRVGLTLPQFRDDADAAFATARQAEDARSRRRVRVRPPLAHRSPRTSGAALARPARGARGRDQARRARSARGARFAAAPTPSCATRWRRCTACSVTRSHRGPRHRRLAQPARERVGSACRSASVARAGGRPRGLLPAAARVRASAPGWVAMRLGSVRSPRRRPTAGTDGRRARTTSPAEAADVRAAGARGRSPGGDHLGRPGADRAQPGGGGGEARAVRATARVWCTAPSTTCAATSPHSRPTVSAGRSARPSTWVRRGGGRNGGRGARSATSSLPPYERARIRVPPDQRVAAVRLHHHRWAEGGRTPSRSRTSSTSASATPTSPRPTSPSRSWPRRRATRATTATRPAGASPSCARPSSTSTAGASTSSSIPTPRWSRPSVPRRACRTSCGCCSARATQRIVPSPSYPDPHLRAALRGRRGAAGAARALARTSSRTRWRHGRTSGPGPG